VPHCESGTQSYLILLVLFMRILTKFSQILAASFNTQKNTSDLNHCKMISFDSYYLARPPAFRRQNDSVAQTGDVTGRQKDPRRFDKRCVDRRHDRKWRRHSHPRFCDETNFFDETIRRRQNGFHRRTP
jgi:hypothetical protein